jgi:hypothetical protein
VTLPENRTELPEYSQYKNLVAEIQVRTILQHAWAEMEHDIRYKSAKESPPLVNQKFTSLAGLIEIADREFQMIQDEITELDQAVESQANDAEILRKFNKSGQYPDKKTKKEQDCIKGNSTVNNTNNSVHRYTELIKNQPSNYTLYIGRARANFLKGNITDAIKDITIAEKKHPEDTNGSIKNLKSQIQYGKLDYQIELNSTRNGHQMLSKGDGEGAFKEYSNSQMQGVNQMYSTINKAMALALIKDHDAVKYYLNQIKPIKNSPTDINLSALNAIASHIDSNMGYKTALKELKEKIRTVSNFYLSQSPLRFLKSGFKAKDIKLSKELETIFNSMEPK